MKATDELPIRPEWMFEVRSVCQAFQCHAWLADRAEFEWALRRLRRSIPPARSSQEAQAVRDLLRMGVVDAARVFHASCHQNGAPRGCSGSPVDAVHHVWSECHDDPLVTLAIWADRFLEVCDTTHPSSPAERAAAILRDRFRLPVRLDALARAVGLSRSALTRRFRQRYGMPCGEFVTRLRLRWFVDEMRKPGANAGRLAEEAGYRTYQNLLDALWHRTGLTPRDIPGLSHNQIRELLDDKLTLSASQARSSNRLSGERLWALPGSPRS